MDRVAPLAQGIGYLAAALLGLRALAFIRVFFLAPSRLGKYSARDGAGRRPWALVTGASDGIGLELARLLRRAGFSVLLHGRNAAKLAGVTERLRAEDPDSSSDGGAGARELDWIAASAAEPRPSVAALVAKLDEIEKQGRGTLRVLINNVGGSNMFGERVFHSVEEAPPEMLEGIVALNVLFPLLLTRALLPRLDSPTVPGLVINVGSMSGLYGSPYVTTYSSSKAFVHTFSSALASEMTLRGRRTEVLGVVVGDVVSAGNIFSRLGTATISSADMARDILARVGCGRALIVGNWIHAMQDESMGWMPFGVGRGILEKAMAKRRSIEDKML
jgi:17beta-estradiol 17-dehydrogenase / very-long-chain 3-oxoacyl-CoA reductase